MRKSRIFGFFTLVVPWLTILPLFVTFADTTHDRLDTVYETGSSYESMDLIILTPGHTRTVYFELYNTLLKDFRAVHTTFILTLGSGILTVGVANSSFIGKDSEIIYYTFGFVNATPVFDYSYSSGVISASIEVPEFGFGFLSTGVLLGIGNPAFPMLMSMTFTLN